MKEQTLLFESGNELAAYAARQINYHVMGYYPITPSTQIAEYLDRMGADGEHTIALGQKDGKCLVEYVRIFQEELIPYEQYLAANSAAAAPSDLYLQIEGENATLKSSSQLHAAYDRSSRGAQAYKAMAEEFKNKL